VVSVGGSTTPSARPVRGRTHRIQDRGSCKRLRVAHTSANSSGESGAEGGGQGVSTRGIAQSLRSDQRVVTIAVDTGLKYLDGDLYR
jgi:hypothetical protein